MFQYDLTCTNTNCSRNFCTRFTLLEVSDIGKVDKKLTSLEYELQLLREEMNKSRLPAPDVAFLATLPRFELWCRRNGSLEPLALSRCYFAQTEIQQEGYSSICLGSASISVERERLGDALERLKQFQPVALLDFRRKRVGFTAIISKTRQIASLASFSSFDLVENGQAVSLQPGPPCLLQAEKCGRYSLEEVWIMWPNM